MIHIWEEQLPQHFKMRWEVYYDRETHIMVNHSVIEFYTRFLFKIDALPQDVAFPLEIDATFFNNLSPNIREFLI